jgi:hypothetical protein
MNFSTSPIGFGNDVLADINSIRLRLLGDSPPPVLFHYTSLEGVIGITNSRSLRAFCVANQKDTVKYAMARKLSMQKSRKC